MLRMIPVLVLLATASILGVSFVPSSSGDLESARADTLDQDSRAVFDMLQEVAEREGWSERPFSEIIEAVGKALQGQTYVDGLLDAPDDEVLVADLTRFDCVLFVENVLAVSNGIATGESSPTEYLRTLEDFRYRDGTRNGYASRLHYFSDWIADNEARGRVENVTNEIGGEQFDKQLTFMGTHRSSYRRLANSDSLYARILDMEERLNNDLEVFYIPQGRIAEAYPLMETGDVIATATRIGGLDVSHTGFAVEMPDGRMGFMHASLSAGEVIVSSDLQSYVENIDHQLGVVVARPMDPRSGGKKQVESD